MHKVTKEQMNGILSCMNRPVNGVQDAVFETLTLNPYDYCENGGELEFNTVIYTQDILNRFDEAQQCPEDFSIFSEKREKELSNGSELTFEEKEALKSEYIEGERNSLSAEYATVSAISDGAQTVYTLYFESCHGQGGIHINQFFGFFASEQEARNKMKNLDGILII